MSPNSFILSLAAQGLELEQAQDLRRSVLCGELHLSREAVDDGRDGEAKILLACLGAKPVGTARLLQGKGAWTLDLLAVLTPYRGQGLGRRLVQGVLQEARALGAGALFCVSPAASLPFFLACGFVHQEGDPGLSLLKIDLEQL